MELEPAEAAAADPGSHKSRILVHFPEGQAALNAPPSTAARWVNSLGAVAEAQIASTGKASENEPLYDDDCVTLYKDRLVAKCYFFPTGGKKTVQLRDIRSVCEHRGGIMNTKGWGMAAVRKHAR